MVRIHNGIYFGSREQCNFDLCGKLDGIRDHCVELKTTRLRNINVILTHK